MDGRFADTFAEVPSEPDQATVQVVAGPGPQNMLADEVGMRDAVTVEEHQVLTRSRQDRLVEDFRLAEAVVFMPDMLQWVAKVAPVPFNQGPGVLARPIIGNEHLILPAGLPTECHQTPVQQARLVVGGYNYGDTVHSRHLTFGSFCPFQTYRTGQDMAIGRRGPYNSVY
jgi:hypothetical protein